MPKAKNRQAVLYLTMIRLIEDTGSDDEHPIVTPASIMDEHPSFHQVRHCRWIALAAQSLNGVIGLNGKLPWNIPAELKWFRRFTIGHPVVMGRRTYQSVGPLKGRRMIVLSKTLKSIDGADVYSDINKLDRDLSDAGQEDKAVFLCGGAEIYASFLRDCDGLILTTVKRLVEGDARMPYQFEQWFNLAFIIEDNPEFKIEYMERA